jgi:RND family efflux transporter MFP subunit
MRKITLRPALVGSAILFTLAGAMLFTECSKKADIHAQAGQEMVYHCPMHPNYLSHQPGNCPICGMTLVPVNSSAPQTEKGKGKVLYYRDAMNPSHTSDKPGKAPDGMDLVPVYESDDQGNGVRIDPAMVQSIGVQTEKVTMRALTQDIRATATIMPDERRISIITTKVMGYVQKLFVNYTGQRVKVGQALYSVYSPDLVSAQAEYLQVFKNIDSKDSGQLIRSARKRLSNWDVTEAQIAELEKRGTPERALTIVSPAEGIVAEKMVVEGQTIEPGMQLYKLIDYSRVWAEAAIYQQDVPLVNIGQKGTIDLDYYPGEHFTGTITYIAPELNMETRTLKVRLETTNTSTFKIKPGMNATVTIHSTTHKKALTVPDQAIIHSGLRTLVVVAKGNGYFEPREIKTGRTAGGYTEVSSGVSEGEDIVVSSQFLIDSESNLKAAIMKMSTKKDSSGTTQKGNSTTMDSTTQEMEGMKGM